MPGTRCSYRSPAAPRCCRRPRACCWPRTDTSQHRSASVCWLIELRLWLEFSPLKEIHYILCEYTTSKSFSVFFCIWCLSSIQWTRAGQSYQWHRQPLSEGMSHQLGLLLTWTVVLLFIFEVKQLFSLSIKLEYLIFSWLIKWRKKKQKPQIRNKGHIILHVAKLKLIITK